MTYKKPENICRICGKKYKSKYKYSKTCSKQCANEWQSRVNKGIAIKKFNDRNKGRYFYVSGYEHYESDFYVRCVACDSIVHIGKGMIRRVAKECPVCLRIVREKQAYENAIRITKRKRIALEKMRAKENIRYTYVCAQCGEGFVSARRGVRYCSVMCRKRVGYKKKEITRRMRISKNGKTHWDISIDKLIKKDRGVCHICGDRVDKNDYKHISGAYIAGLRHPSIDHIMPLSKGGTHTWDNVKLAHMGCNALKNDREIYEGSDKQMMFAI